jgi:hypothetical protein
MLTVNHFSASDGLSSSGVFAIDVSLKSAWGLHQQFESLVRDVPQRLINWERTFARRGYRSRDYFLERCDDRSDGTQRYLFLRNPKAAADVLEEQRFVREGDFKATLQGEVFTYVKAIPFLSALPRHWVQMAAIMLPAETRHRMPQVTYLFTKGEMRDFFELPEGSSFGNSIFDSQLFDGWDADTSFLTVSKAA